MPDQIQVPLSDSILRRKEVVARTGLSFMTLHRRIAAGLFPKPVILGANSVGWLESEVNKWLAGLANLRKGTAAPEIELGGASLAALTAEIARRTPDMMVQLEGMEQPMRVADALQWIDDAAARDRELGELVQVAADCNVGKTAAECRLLGA